MAGMIKKYISDLPTAGRKGGFKAPSFLTEFTYLFPGIFFAFLKLCYNKVALKQKGCDLMPLKKNSVLTTKEAIKYLKISKPTFLKYCRERRIKAIKAGKGWKVLQSELDRFLRGEVS